MAFLNALVLEPTNDPVIDVLFDGYVWDLSQSRTITWALADGLNPADIWSDRSAAIATFAAALDAFEQFINVNFSYLGAFDDPVAAGLAGADIVYTLDNTTVDDGTLAYAYFPGPDAFNEFEQYQTEGGDVFMNFSDDLIASSSFRLGSEGFLTVIHEIGHALGLKHPFEATPGRPSIDDLDTLLFRDIDWFTIMSYDDNHPDELERWDPSTPMLLDVLALQYVYGVNSATNAGDTTLRLTSEIHYYTIWDASGIDTVDASGQSEGWVISLPDVQPTPLLQTLAGFAMPLAQFVPGLVDSVPTELVWLMGDMENATGSPFDDQITGNRFDNLLIGGGGDDYLEGYGGNDTIDGGAGRDTAAFLGDQSTYTVILSRDSVTVQDRTIGGDGTNSLRNVELIDFYTVTDLHTLDLVQFGGMARLDAADLETVVELYIAYFNRAPDALGLNFWGTAYANGVSLQEMAALFIDQDETRAAYPQDLSNADFATVVYNNVLGRVPDQAGFDFWVGALDSGGVGRDQFILVVLEGARADPAPGAAQDFIDQQQADRAYLASKTDLGALFAVHRGMSNVDNASEVMALFDGSADSLNRAVAEIEQYHAQALDPDSGAFLMPLVGVLDNPFDAIA